MFGKIDEIYRLTLENHQVLQTIRRQQYAATFFRIIYWVVVLGAIGSTYYYVKPFVGDFMANKDKIIETMKQLNELRLQLPEASMLQKVMEGLKTQP